MHLEKDVAVPYVGTVPETLGAGKMVRIQGLVLEQADRFNINLQTGPASKPRDDTALHISVRLNQGYVARNSYSDGGWGEEDGGGQLPIGHGQQFEIIVLFEENHFKIAINGQHFCQFPARIPIEKITHLLIDGDVRITIISWEDCNAAAAAAAAAAETHAATQSTQNEGTPTNYGPPPPQQSFPPQQGFPPQGLPPQGFPPQGPPPQGGPYGYGPPMQGGGYYGPPPPPGSEPESKMDGILDTAQSVLASAVASGAAEKLLSGIFSSNQNQQNPQNMQYAQQPPPQPNYQQPQSNEGGLAEKLLGSLLGGGQHASYGQYPHPPQQMGGNVPQFGGEGSVGGLGSVGSFLTSLAGQALSGSRNVPLQRNY